MTQTVDPWSKRRHSLGIPVHRHCHDHGRGRSPAAGVTTAHRSPAGGRILLPFCVLTWATSQQGVRWGKAQMRGPVSRETLMDHSISAVH